MLKIGLENNLHVSPKQTRRIEFDESISRSRARSIIFFFNLKKVI
jgi:hypothetical protein